jgi:hypothetical protein
MKIPPFWAKETFKGLDRKGKELAFSAWGWSFDSINDAKKAALARARKIFDNLESGIKPDTYDYLERPLKEEILEKITENGEDMAIITRNRYGSTILNCQSACFADIDFPRPKSKGFFDALKMMFSPRHREERKLEVQEATTGRIREWSSHHKERSFRLYRTAAGLRLLFTDRLYDPSSKEVSELFEELGSDQLYRKLTLKQESFRARLSPKPWRCGCGRPPKSYPWESPDAEQIYRAWLGEYDAKSKGFSTCLFLGDLGAKNKDNPIISKIVAVHDSHACHRGNPSLA